MAKPKRKLWDELVEVGRELLESLETLLNPEKKQRKLQRAPVPVPVRNKRSRRYPYDNQR